MAATDVPHAQAVPLCAITKAAQAAEWQEGARPGARVLTMGIVCTPPRRGLHVELYVHRGQKVLRRTIDFGLWDSTSGVQERVYQLTIADSASPTHAEKGEVWYGSHEHVGDVAVKLDGLDNIGFHEALQRFCDAINLTIEDGSLSDPFHFKLH